MSRNRNRFQKGLFEAQFQALYGDEEQCRTLAEFEWRFNNRFDLAEMIPALGRAAAASKPAPYWWLESADYGA